MNAGKPERFPGMQFEFSTAVRIIFRSGAVADLPNIAREFGTRALLVTGRNTARVAPLTAGLQRAGIESSIFSVETEPTLDIIRAGVHQARQTCDLVIGFGGGSAIDAGKAIAALATNSGEPLDYLEIIGHGRALERLPLPFIAVPTTAGTGAEVTRNAVLGSFQDGVKASLRSPLMLPKAALIDPDLTLNLPPEITASTGLDALTQLIEPYVSTRANPLADLFCIEGMERVSACLVQAWRSGGDHQARQSMSFASVLGGLALANAALGVVHGFAAPLGAMLHAPHGALCAAVLPHGMAINIQALRRRAPEHEALCKYHDIARILTDSSTADPEDGAVWVADLCQQLSIPRLGAHGLDPRQIPALVEKAAKTNSTKGNPIRLTTQELTEIVDRAL
ncbi:MAG: iron-containing alcohol dehydrogenase [Bryobacteraceae bacterium]